MRSIITLLLVLASLAAAPTTQTVILSPSATLVTAKLPNASPKQMFDEIAKQSDETFEPMPSNLFEINPLADIRFSVEFDHDPYWRAVLDSCREANLAMYERRAFAAPRASMVLESRNMSGSTRSCCWDGAVLFVLNEINRTNRIDYGSPLNRRPDEVRVSAAILVEPKFRLFSSVGPVAVKRAIDSAGNSLKPTAPPRRKVDPLWQRGGLSRALSIAMEYPKKPGDKLKEVSGEVELRVPRRLFKGDFPIQQNDASTTAGLNKLFVRTSRASDKRIEVIVELVREEDSDEDWQVSSRLFDSDALQISIRSSTGETFAMNDRSEMAVGPAHAAVRAFYAQQDRPGQTPERLLIQFPVELQTISAQFSFRDLPMP